MINPVLITQISVDVLMIMTLEKILIDHIGEPRK